MVTFLIPLPVSLSWSWSAASLGRKHGTMPKTRSADSGGCCRGYCPSHLYQREQSVTSLRPGYTGISPILRRYTSLSFELQMPCGRASSSMTRLACPLGEQFTMLGSMTPRTWDQGHSQATTPGDPILLVPGPIFISEPRQQANDGLSELRNAPGQRVWCGTAISGDKGSLALKALKGSCGQREDILGSFSPSLSVFMLTRALHSAGNSNTQGSCVPTFPRSLCRMVSNTLYPRLAQNSQSSCLTSQVLDSQASAPGSAAFRPPKTSMLTIL